MFYLRLKQAVLCLAGGGDLGCAGSLPLLLEELVVVLACGLLLQGVALLKGALVPLALQALGGDQALDLGCLPHGLLASLAGNLAADDVLADIIVLGKVVQLADLACALGAQAAGLLNIGQSSDLAVTLLQDNEVKNRQVGADNAAADGLALALTAAALAEGGHT